MYQIFKLLELAKLTWFHDIYQLLNQDSNRWYHNHSGREIVCDIIPTEIVELTSGDA